MVTNRTIAQRLLDIAAIVLVPGAAVLCWAWPSSSSSAGLISRERTPRSLKNVINRGSEGVVTCTIESSFTDGSGREYRRGGKITDSLGAKNPPRNFVVVEYVRTDPSRSRILTENWSGIYATVGALFVLGVLWLAFGPGRWNRSNDERVLGRRAR
jgi:hypothetical protein